VARIATVRWSSPEPSSIDEELVLDADGSVWLAVRRPSTDTAAIGTYRLEASEAPADHVRALGELDGGALEVDLLHPPLDGVEWSVADAARRLAAVAREHPYAVARFHGTPAGGTAIGGDLMVALVVVGEGVAPVRFELDPSAGAVHFSAGAPLSWVPLPPIATGFVTPEAEGLGGLRGRAEVAPGAFGTLALPVSAPTGTTEVSVQVAGWLVEALPDAPMPERFEARTSVTPLPSPPG
jgi:hypothetical protein